MKNSNVLVLNSSWLPIHISPLKSAIGLIYSGRAKVVATKDIYDIANRIALYEFQTLDYDEWCEVSERLDKHKYKIINSSKNKHFTPSVIVRLGNKTIPKYAITFNRQSLYDRDNGKCQYCSKQLNKKEATIDHIIPKSKGGTNEWDNVVIACKPCNSRKGDILLDQCGLTLISPPKKPTWISTKFGRKKSVRENDDWKRFTDYIGE